MTVLASLRQKRRFLWKVFFILHGMNQKKLLEWYKENHRDLPFRRQRNPYNIWISEIMSQQTRIEAMLPYYERFTAKYPDVAALAAADDTELLKMWQGLGYYSRARNLKKAAQACMEQYGGQLPETKEELKKLPGIGDYTAGAIASICYGHRVSAIDGNVIRVVSRYYWLALDFTKAKNKKVLERYVLDDLPDEEDMHFWNQALMELGASICLPQNPKCEACPIKEGCKGYEGGFPALLPLKKSALKRTEEQKQVWIWMALKDGVPYIKAGRRPSSGLLANMAEFCLEPPKNMTASYDLGSYRHVFSHKEWIMDGHLAMMPWNEDMMPLEEFEHTIPLPSAYEPFYKEAKKHL